MWIAMFLIVFQCVCVLNVWGCERMLKRARGACGRSARAILRIASVQRVRKKASSLGDFHLRRAAAA